MLVDARTDLVARAQPVPPAGQHRHGRPGDRRAHRGRPGRRCPASGWSTRSCCRPPVPPRWTRGCACCGRGPAQTPRRRWGPGAGELVIDEATYAARLRGRLLELTYKEFELLKYLAQHAGRVFTRAQLLQEVWGYDFFGGTRTVDVHVRRLRAKLGTEHEQMIGTVRNVGYKFVRPNRAGLGVAAGAADDADERTTTTAGARNGRRSTPPPARTERR